MTVSLTKEVYVNVYELDRGYGGPEEGGWWYDTGEILESRHVALDAVAAVRAQLREAYPDTGNASNVRYRGGEYGIYMEDDPGQDFPANRPHYE